MSENQNGIIAKWMGWKEYQSEEHPEIRYIDKNYIVYEGDFATSDADAISLLPVLVERGYNYKMESRKPGNVFFQIYSHGWDAVTKFNTENTISKAITAAVLQLVEQGNHAD